VPNFGENHTQFCLTKLDLILEQAAKPYSKYQTSRLSIIKMKRNRSLNTTNGSLAKQDGVKLFNYMFRPAFVAIVRLQSSSVKSLYNMLLDCNMTMATNAGRNM